jgi:hypothetical protein
MIIARQRSKALPTTCRVMVNMHDEQMDNWCYALVAILLLAVLLLALLILSSCSSIDHGNVPIVDFSIPI